MNSDAPQRRSTSDRPIARTARGSARQRTVVIVTNTCLAGVGTLYITTRSVAVVIAGCCLAVFIATLTLATRTSRGK
jgi:hypothetical protein